MIKHFLDLLNYFLFLLYWNVMEVDRLKNSEWWELDSRLLWVYQNKVDPGSSSHQLRNCEYFSVWFLKRGRVDMVFADGKSYRVDAGNWVALFPGMQKSQLFSHDAEIISTAFVAKWPDGASLLKADKPVIFSSGCDSLFEKAVETLRDYVVGCIEANYMRQAAAKIDFTVYARSNILAWEFFCRWFELMLKLGCRQQLQEDVDPRLRSALFVLRKHHFNQPLPYEQLCRRSGLSRSHFDRLFVRQFGKSPKKFCETICFENTIRLLSSNSISVKEAAFESGFVNVAHFCTWFKRRTGHTPEQYRRFLV